MFVNGTIHFLPFLFTNVEFVYVMIQNSVKQSHAVRFKGLQRKLYFPWKNRTGNPFIESATRFFSRHILHEQTDRKSFKIFNDRTRLRTRRTVIFAMTMTWRPAEGDSNSECHVPFFLGRPTPGASGGDSVTATCPAI